MSEAFLKVVNMSISAGWLVLVVLALRLILKKAPKWVNVLLWGIVAVRLICPFSIESALSLIPSKETISPEIMMDWTPEISTGIEPLDQVVNPVISTSFAPNPGTSANPLQILIPVAANLWLLGVLILLAYTAISYLSLRHKLRTAVILRDNIFQCETVSSPFVLGILKPKIYLPYSMDGNNLDHVVAHEQAHIKRKDHWWKPLGFLLLTVYWFNPLMWVAYILLCRDIELACDEKVIAELGYEQRADYTQALVACAVNRRMIAACPLAFGEVGVKDRVKSIMNYRKPTFWIIGVSVLICVVVAVCFLTNPEKYGEPDLSLLNYKNAVNLVIDQDEVMAIYCPTSDESGSQIQIGAADGNELAKYLNQWSWKECKAPKDTLSSPGSVEFVIDDEYRITVYQKKSGALRQYAVVTLQEDVRYYSIDRNDYADAVALVHSPANSVDGEIAGKTYVYENEGILGSFAITLYEDGSFTYFEGLASSYLGNGSWTQEGDNITMTDDGEGGYGLVNHFKFIGENLVFVEHNSSNFVYVKVKDGERFYRTGEAFKSNGVIINSDISVSSLYAKVLEIHDGYYLVEPVKGSWELNSASQIEVPMKNMEPSPEPQVGDILEIEYDGQLHETYPARIIEVYGIRVISERPYVTEALTLNEVAELVKQQHTVSFVGMMREAVHGYWGKPDYEAFGFFGDIYHVPDTFESIVFRYDESEIVTAVEIEYRNEVPGDALFIVEIRDREKEEHLDCAEAEELFFEDDEYEYYFNVIKSHYVIVTYNDANSEDIITALNSGRATIADLDEFDIEYTKKPKS